MFYVDMHAARYIIDDWFEIDEIENYYVAFLLDLKCKNINLIHVSKTQYDYSWYIGINI